MKPFHLKGPKRGVTLREVGSQGAYATVTETKTFPQKEFALFKNFNTIISFCSVCQMKAIHLFKGLYIKVQKKKALPSDNFLPSKLLHRQHRVSFTFKVIFSSLVTDASKSRPVSSVGRASDF